MIQVKNWDTMVLVVYGKLVRNDTSGRMGGCNDITSRVDAESDSVW